MLTEGKRLAAASWADGAPDQGVHGERGRDDRQGSSDDASRALTVHRRPRHLVWPAYGRDVRAAGLQRPVVFNRAAATGGQATPQSGC